MVNEAQALNAVAAEFKVLPEKCCHFCKIVCDSRCKKALHNCVEHVERPTGLVVIGPHDFYSNKCNQSFKPST
jgi:hypothetical protein